MAPWPLTTTILDGDADDVWPALYTYSEGVGAKRRRYVAIPALDVKTFIKRDMALGFTGKRLGFHWLAGSKRPASQLHLQVAQGRQLVAVERMEQHLMWDTGGKLYLKPMPAYLLNSTSLATNLDCDPECNCAPNPLGPPATPLDRPAKCQETTRGIALGFLYTYACLISSELDFHLANKARLLPHKVGDKMIEWKDWKGLARKIHRNHDRHKVHPRFHRPELRLGRINNIHRFTKWPLFTSHVRTWRTYGALLRDNVAWMATAAVFIALVLTAMQVGLGTTALQDDERFQTVALGFTVFSLASPLGAVAFVLLSMLYSLVKDVPWLFRSSRDAVVPPGNQNNLAQGNQVAGQHDPNAVQPPADGNVVSMV